MYKTILVFLLLQWGALISGSQAVCADFHFVTLQFPPLEYENDKHEADGAVVEIVRTIMGNLGYTVDIRVLPWTRAMRMVGGGKADAIFTAYKNADREQFLDYSEEVLLDQEIYFYKKRGSSFDFDGRIASIRDARIGIVSTISYGQAFDRYRQFIRLDKANQLTHSLQKLAKGRIDLLPSTYFVAEYTIKQMGMEKQVERMPRMIESLPSYIAFSKKRDLHFLRGQFDEELKKLKATGEYFRILQKHGMTK
jgi:polar amino acid transport system substrate-binding protein